MAASGKFVKPEIIARLRGLELRSRGAVSGSVAGMHRSVYRGYSVEFAEHRPYVPGDDLRHIDWRLFGRKDRFFVKQYEEETNLECHLLLDISSSMTFTSGGLTKFDYACFLTASIAYLIAHQNDAAGLIAFDDRIRAKLPAHTGKAHLANLLALLEKTTPAGTTDVKILFHRLAEELRRRSLAVVISDLLADPEDVLTGLEHIAYAGHELILLHVMDDHEWNFPFVENTLFEGIEDQTQLLADPQSLRASYLDAVQNYTARLRALCLKHRADYVPINTRVPIDVVLSAFLSKRSGVAGRVL